MPTTKQAPLMNKYFKTALNYMGIFALTAFLLWFSLRSLQAEEQDSSEFLWEAWQKTDKIFLMLMAVTATLSHFIRSLRWKMLLEPSGNNIGAFTGLWAILIGYLVNLVVPRGGELSRCYYLMKLEKTPVQVSFGTVVTERLIDLICLLILIVAAFFSEWEKLAQFIQMLPFSADYILSLWPWLIVVAAVLAGFVYLVGWLRKNEKFRHIIHGFKEGLLSVFKLKNRKLFILYSVLIWTLYFVMSYFVVLSFPETKDLGVSAILTLFALGSIAMAVPLPGGTGSYHTIVPLGLVALYNIEKSDAVAFVFIFHAWQTAVMIFSGIISLLIAYALMKWKPQKK